MKTWFYCISAAWVILCATPGKSQEKWSDRALYKISYRFTFLYDTTDRNKKSTEEVTLYVGASYSVFRDAGFDDFERKKKEQIRRLSEQLSYGSHSISLQGINNNIKKTELFRKINNNILLKKETLLSEDYLIEDVLPTINWKVAQETKILGGLECQKALGFFRGRAYTVCLPARCLST